jgi:2-polyprenyl-6-methoxyphenol hydroxylase-like FAD-dependent oxidoreductase
MTRIGIIGSGIAGLHLGLSLQQSGILTTLYAERTPAEVRGRRLSNMVARNASTRARERALGVDHWDDPSYDMARLAVRIAGAQPIAFSGRMAPAQAVDMRIYCARLMEDYADRGGRIVIHTVEASEIEDLASNHDLIVAATGRAAITNIFPRIAEDSPYTQPQRLSVGGLFLGIRPSEPCALEVNIIPGGGEILAVPMQSFGPDLTGLGIMIAPGGALEPLRHLRHDDDPPRFAASILEILRAHAPRIYERTDPQGFRLSRPIDLCYAAITPTVRQGFTSLPGGRHVLAMGDSHVIIDPVTGQGANNASHAAAVVSRAIGEADAFDREFCERVEREVRAYVVPVSEAANARLRAPSPHFRDLLIAAARDQEVADVYADGYNHPDRFWATAGDADRTAQFLRDRQATRAAVTSSP